MDAPEFTRKIVNFKRLSLTDLKVDIPRLASKKVLTAKLAESGELYNYSARVFAAISAAQGMAI